MVDLIFLSEARVTPTGPCSILPEYLSKAISQAEAPIRRAFVLPENDDSLAINNTLIASLMRTMAAHAPFSAEDFLFIDRSGEAGSSLAQRREMLQTVCREIGLPIRQVVYVSQNPCIGLALTPYNPRWLFFHHYFASMSRRYRHIDSDYRYEASSDRVLCLNGKIRPHRLAVAAYLSSSEFASRCHITWGGGEALFKREDALLRIKEHLPSFFEVSETSNLDVRVLAAGVGVGGFEDIPLSETESCFMQFVTESDYLPRMRRVTEKVLKPIAAHRPFLSMVVQVLFRYLRNSALRPSVRSLMRVTTPSASRTLASSQ